MHDGGGSYGSNCGGELQIGTEKREVVRYGG